MKAGWKLKRLEELGTGVRDQAKIAPDAEYELWSVPAFASGAPETAMGGNIGSAKLRLRPDDVLICKINPRINRVWLVVAPVNGREQIGSTEWLVFRQNNNTELLPSWLIYFLSAPKFREWIVSEVSGATGSHTRAKADGILRQEIPVPPLPEQRRIVGILDEAFAGIATARASAERNLQNARALFESHLNTVEGDPAPLGDLVEIRTGKLDANAAVEGGEYPFFTCAREVYAIDRYAFECEAILLAGNNAVGDFNVKHYKGKFNAYQRTYVITVNEMNRVLYRFLYFQMLKSLAKFKSQSVGAGTKFLKLGMIKNMEIALPTLAEQERIVSEVDSIREETQRLESIYQRKLAALDELKKSLLHQAFSGEL